MEFDFDIFDQQPKPTPQAQCCPTPDITQENGNSVCTSCGIVNTTIQFYELSHDDERYRVRIQYYKRISYFREKLKLLACIKLSNSPKYAMLMNLIKDHQLITDTRQIINNQSDEFIVNYIIHSEFLRKLRKLIKSLGYSKLFKYIYVIIFDLFKFQCFHIENRHLDRLCIEWVKFEKSFKIKYPMATNMISYNVILKKLLIKYNIPNHDLIIIPSNLLTIESKIENIF